MKIVVDNVPKTFGNTNVIEDASMELESGRVYGFQGINGCGKTMLMRLVSGLIHPTKGTISVDGKALQGENSFPESMGLLIENPSFLNSYSGYQNLEMLAGISGKIGKEDVLSALERVGLKENADKKYGKYSLGMRQRLGIACAVMEKPELILLDEPFISLDEAGVETVAGIIKQEKARGALIILACHDYGLLSEASDEIFRIVGGKLAHHLVKGDDGVFSEVAL